MFSFPNIEPKHCVLLTLKLYSHLNYYSVPRHDKNRQLQQKNKTHHSTLLITSDPAAAAALTLLVQFRLKCLCLIRTRIVACCPFIPLTVHSLSGPSVPPHVSGLVVENDKLAKWSTIEQNRRNNLWLSAEHHHQRPIRHQTCLSLCNTGEQAFFEGKRRRNEVKNLLISN